MNSTAVQNISSVTSATCRKEFPDYKSIIPVAQHVNEGICTAIDEDKKRKSMMKFVIKFRLSRHCQRVVGLTGRQTYRVLTI